MTKEITQLQAMQHPTVVATINVLAEMNRRLQDENDELKAALAAEREACANVAALTVCDTHIPTGIKIYGAVAAKAIRARSET